MDSMETGDSVPVWYDVQDPSVYALKDEVENGQATSIESALMGVAPVILGVLGGAGLFLNFPVAWVVVGFIAVTKVVPDLIRRLLSPTVVTEYKTNADAQITEPAEPMRHAA